VFAVVAHQLRWHSLHFAAVEHIQKQRLQNVVPVMAKRNLGGTQFGCGAVQNAATQT